MSLIGRGGNAIAEGFEELGTADVSNVAGATDTFDLPSYVGDGTPQITVITPVTVQTGNVTITGADATDLIVVGLNIVATTVTNVVSAVVANTLSNADYYECGLSVRSGSVLNVWRLLFVGNGTGLVIYAKKEV